MQQRGTANHELDLLDVGRELETIELPEAVLDTVREQFPIERPADDRRVTAGATAETATGADTDTDADTETATDTDVDTEIDVDTGTRTGTDTDTETTIDEDETEPDEGVPSPT